MYELRALQSVDLSHNQLSSIGEHFERMISLHTLDLSGNEGIDPDNLPTRTRRLHEKV
jgi:Leucine-rich repeat (LRR) protein